MAKSNPRYECSSPTCNMKNTRNQLKGSNGICIHCKTPMAHTNWMGGLQGSISQILSIPVGDDADLQKADDVTGLQVKDLVRAAVQLKLKEWLEDPENIEKTVKQDVMLAKLYGR